MTYWLQHKHSFPSLPKETKQKGEKAETRMEMAEQQ